MAVTEIESLSRRFLNGDVSCVLQFQKDIRPLVIRITRRYARDLAEDQIEDVIQETLLILLQMAGSGFDSARGSAATFVGLVARRAARDVSAQYAPAGRQTRPPSSRDVAALEEFRRQGQVVSLDNLPENLQPEADDFVLAVDARLDAATILDAAPPAVAYALQRVHIEDASVREAAVELGLSRFALNRMVLHYRETVAA